MLDDRTLDKLKPYVIAAAVAQVVGLVGAAALSNLAANSNVEHSFNGMLDLPAKHYAAEVLLGASDGMKANGWSNFGIEERLAVVKAATQETIRDQMAQVYDQAYAQGISGQWDEAALSGYLEVVEMPKSDIYRLNQATLEGDEKINPEALNAKIEADYGARWDDVGKHFREGLEGMIHTSVASVEIAFGDKPYSEARSISEMQAPVYQAAQVMGFMTSGPNEPNALLAHGELEVVDARVPVERLAVNPTERVEVEMGREKRALDPKFPRIEIALAPLGEHVQDPFAVELTAEQDMSNDDPDQPS
ncbi:hypothetical protein ACGYLO_10940 [Sulfitobacter sp. 1A13353]|uniref:hypothetical protein n=1 Tax=Sulfitobacter sp. 1A13353 TaxID=3368568 RepID=UPI0037473DFD